MSLKIGYAQEIITPSLDRPVFLAGFGRNRRAESVHDDLYVRTLTLENNGRFVIVAALDLIGLHREQCQTIEARVAAQIPQAQMLITCTHTHHGPDTMGLWGPDEQTSGVDDIYMDTVFAKVVKTAVSATENMQEARLSSTSIVVPGVVHNVRDPDITDEELTCLQFHSLGEERPLTTWLIFPCHPEVLWDENPHITSDYIFTLRQMVEAETSAPCLCQVGALGGMMTPDVVDHSFAEAEAMGHTLAQAALAELADCTPVEVTRLEYIRQEYSLLLENPLFKMAADIGVLPQIEREDGTLLTEASLLWLGDVVLCAVPGELLPKLGLQYRQMMKEAGGRITAVIGLANDELGYILPAEDFTPPENYLEPGSSYEESMSVSATAGPALTSVLQKLLEE